MGSDKFATVNAALPIRFGHGRSSRVPARRIVSGATGESIWAVCSGLLPRTQSSQPDVSAEDHVRFHQFAVAGALLGDDRKT